MRLPKRYGDSKLTVCPFCKKQAMTSNSQGVPVCKLHTNLRIPEIRCTCGRWLEMKKSKWGPFFVCDSCGPVAFKKGLEMLKMMKPQDAIQLHDRN